jgi:D-alanyl-D-alanine carboxypeptidase/D-alanyl-D-alanine-endopeptidase (penicillin-binding protein 4)
MALVCLGALAAPGAAWAGPGGPDQAFRTPLARGAAAAHTAVSGSSLRLGLARLFRGVGRRSGAFVLDSATDQVLFGRRAGRPRLLASNSKLFTTATALSRFGPDGHLETTVWSADDVSDGVSQGLFLRGGGDPTLNNAGLARLAARVRAAGVTSVVGPLYYDNSFLDQKGIPQHGIRRESVGSLTALTLGGLPDTTTAQRFDDALRGAGVAIGTKTERRDVPPTVPGVPPAPNTPVMAGELDSPSIADIARSTNVPSNNYLAEMLLKDTGAAFGGVGTTRTGVAVAKRFAAERGASYRAENGSGLTRRNKASPASVARLLDSMLEVNPGSSPEDQAKQERLRDAFVGSLAVAGRSGTLAHRMRHTAAQDNCHAKTGTLTGVSVLSGYCFRGGSDQPVVFSLLMNAVDVNRAHLVQDRMTGLIARYRP